MNIKKYSYLKRIYREISYFIILLLQIIPNGVYVRLQYFLRYKRFANLRNPKYISEKLNKIKLRKPTKYEIIACNKYYLKKWINDLDLKINTIKTIDYQRKFNDLNWDSYQLPFIVKVSNGSGQQVICRNQAEINKAKREFKSIARKRHYISKREMGYKYLKKGYIVEPYLENDGHLLDDFKVHCFNGDPLYTQINDRNSKSNRMMIDKDFKYYPYPFASGHEDKLKLPKQEHLIEMMKISKNISQYFEFARVDFYIYEDKVYLGEITIYRVGGYVLRNSKSLDEKWGSLLKTT